MQPARNEPVVRLTGDGPHATIELQRPDGRWVRTSSARDPAAEAARWVAAAMTADTALVAVVGLGLGHVLDEIERRAPEARVIALEPGRALAALCGAQPRVADRLGRGRLAVLHAPDFTPTGDVRRWLAEAAGDVPVVVNPVLARECPASVSAARDRLRQFVFEAAANRHAREANAGRYLLNTLRNLGAIAREGDAAALGGAFGGQPAVLVAAGPSLDGAIEEVRRHERRAVIIAVDTAVKPLLGRGIEPDFVVAVDPTEANARHLADVPPLERTWLVAEPSVDPALLDAFRGRTFLFSLGFEPWPWITAHGGPRGTLRAWGSVATTALDLALALGCDPIVCAGYDFAFTGGRPYCRGTEYEHGWADAVAWGVPLEDAWRRWVDRWPETFEADADGVVHRTAPHLVAFRDWVAREARRVAGQRRIATLGGGILASDAIPRVTLDALVRPADERAARAGVVAARHRRVAGDLLTARRELRENPTAEASRSLFERWRRFAPGTGDDEIADALRDRPAVRAARRAGPHLRPEGALLVRRLLAGSAVSTLDWTSGEAACIRTRAARLLGMLTAGVNGYLPGAGAHADPALVPASALIDWTGDAYAEIRRLEAAIADHVPADGEGDDPPRDLPAGAVPQAPAADVARRALVREVALAASAGHREAARMLRRLDPMTAPTGAVVRLSTGANLSAEYAADPASIGPMMTGRASAPGEPADARVSHGPVVFEFADARRGPEAAWRRFFSAGSCPIRWRVLRHPECPAALFVTAGRDGRALLTPILRPASVVAGEDGGMTVSLPWPHPVLGEITLASGGAVAWNNTAAPWLMRRGRDGTVDAIEQPPFRPNRVLEWTDGDLICAGYDGGLWRWTPGDGCRLICDAPPSIALHPTPAGIRIDPIVRSAEGFTTRARATPWLWRPGAPSLEPLPPEPHGPCWAEAATAEWRARAFTHEDFIELTHVSGRRVDLGCAYPVSLAWSGRSLFVASTSGGAILLFENLVDVLRAWVR